jgi:hypothetical protein
VSRKNLEISVGGVSYVINQFPASSAMVILGSLVKVAGKPIASLLSSGVNKDISMDLIERAIGSLSETVSPQELPVLLKQILSECMINTGSVLRKVDLDLDFTGSLKNLFLLVKEIVRFNFSDFLPVSASAEMQEAVATKLKAL